MKKFKKVSLHKRDGFKLFLLAGAAIAVLLSVIVVNSIKTSTNTEAASKKCYAKNSVGKYQSGLYRKLANECPAGNYTEGTDPKQPFPTGFVCCIATKEAVRGRDCKQAGGTDWYAESRKVVSAWGSNPGYITTIVDKTNFVGQYYKDKHKNKYCLSVTTQKKPDCRGTWIKAEVSCAVNSTEHAASNSLFGYKSGIKCCVKNVQ